MEASSAAAGTDGRVETGGPVVTTAPSETLAAALAQRIGDLAPVAPSVAYALFDRSGILLHRGSGEYRLTSEPPTVDTVYRIASMSKSVEAAVVLMLRDRGLLGLDDPVASHVPEFVDPVDAEGAAMPVTVRMLLANSSGLPEDNAWADHVIDMQRDEFLALVGRGLSFTERPGAVYQYSNIGFWLLGIMVENLTGEGFAEFATRSLLEPLGLEGTRYDIAEYPDDGAGSGIAEGFSTFDEGATWVARPVIGPGVGSCAASLFSTLTDVARWSAWLSSAFDPEYGDDRVLSRASRREMQRGATVLPSPVDRPAGPAVESAAYGLGLVIEHDTRFGAIAQHSGGLPGWSSNMRWHLASGLGVAVFANSNGAKLGVVAAALLRAALEDLDPPAREVVLWPSTLEAALAIEAAITDGDLLEAARLFSPNLLSDVPAEERTRRLSRAIAEVGGLADAADRRPLRERLLWSASAAHIAFSVPGRTGELECRVETTPTRPSLVQRLDIAKREPTTALSPVVRHYRPLIED